MNKLVICLILSIFINIISGCFTIGSENNSKSSSNNNKNEKLNCTILKDGDTLSGTQKKSICIEAHAVINLTGRILFTPNTTFKINKGAILKGDIHSETYVVIDRGAKIDAQGTIDAPIVFTSSNPVGLRSQQDWGGLIINGYASINGGGVEALGESGTYFGGTNDKDNSGIMKYVRIEFAGKLIAAGLELPGLSLQGIGSNTIIEYVQTHKASDDGIDIFGGTVNLKYIVSTNNWDDQLDVTFGWRGKLQFAALASIDGDEGIEFDNNYDNFNASPQAHAIVSNITTLLGINSIGIGMTIQRGMKADFYNTYMFNGDVLVNDSPTSLTVNSFNVENGNINPHTDGTIIGTIEFSEPDSGNYYLKGANNGLATAKDLAALGASAFEPTNTYITGQKPPSDPFFDQSADYIGAVKSANENWMAGWTDFPKN